MARPRLSNSAALLAARRNRAKTITERNLLLLAWLKSSGYVAHLEPLQREEHMFMGVLCVHTTEGQLTWKLTPEEVGIFGHLDVHPDSHYDGAGSGEKWARLERLGAVPDASRTAPDALRTRLTVKAAPFPFERLVELEKAAERLVVGKRTAGLYAIFVSPNGDNVRATRYLARFIARLPLDSAQRPHDPKDGWLYAGTLEKR